MSYLVLARRWRPRRFDEVVGQPHVVKTLLNGLRQKRLAHAYLFSGPRGVGKTTTARLLARAVNCHNPTDGEPCGECPPCISISEGSFIDTIEIDAASNTGVEDVRKLREAIRYAPIEGKAKVYVIDEVHMLSQGAFNALLKTLEEPPEHAYFCLATTEPQKIPATILSRCQRFDFRRVPAAEIQLHLVNICKQENIKFDDEALDIIARRADGSVRDSLSLLDQIIAFSGGQALHGDTTEVVGEVRYDLYRRAIELIRSSFKADAFRLDQELASLGTDPQDFVIGLAGYLVQLLQIKSLGVDDVDVPKEAREDYTSSAELLSEEDIIRLLQFCSVAETDIRRNYSPRIRLQLLLLRFASFERSVVLSDLINRLEESSKKQQSLAPPPNTESRNHSTKENAVTATDTTTADKTESEKQGKKTMQSDSESSSETGQDRSLNSQGEDSSTNPLALAQAAWTSICEKIAENYNSRGKMIQFGGYPVAYDNGRLRINFSSPTHLKTARSFIATIKREMTAVIGQVKLELEVGDIPHQEEDKTNLDSDPAVKLLMQRLDAQPSRK